MDILENIKLIQTFTDEAMIETAPTKYKRILRLYYDKKKSLKKPETESDKKYNDALLSGYWHGLLTSI